MDSEIERPVEECPACGREDFSGEYGIGFHLMRYCSEATDEQQDFGRILMSGENHPMTGYEMSEEAKEAIGEASRGRTMPPEAREKISESLTGHEVSEETRQKISESLKGENNPWWGVTGEDHPWHGVTGEDHPMYGYEWSEEQLEQLSESHKGLLSAGTKQIDVPETGNTVRSGWEAEIDGLLHDAGIDYEYESQTFDFGEYTYTPDFVCEDGIIVEVKGYVNEGDDQKAKDLMNRHDDLTYIAVGSKLPADHHLTWENRGTLPELIRQLQE